jgi:hypothetical protein
MLAGGLTCRGYAAGLGVQFDNVDYAKIGVLPIAENIAIVDGAVRTEAPLSIMAQDDPIISGQGVRGCLYCGEFAGSDQANAVVALMRQREIKIGGERNGKNISSSVATNLMSGGLTGVFDFDYDGYGLADRISFRPPNVIHIGDDVGAQLAFRGALSREVQRTCSNPQSDCRNSQNEREERDGITRRPLPEGFAVLYLAAALLSGFLTFLFLYFGRHV